MAGFGLLIVDLLLVVTLVVFEIMEAASLKADHVETSGLSALQSMMLH